MAAGVMGTREGDGDAVAPRVHGCALLDPTRIYCLVAWEAGRWRKGTLQHPQGLARCQNCWCLREGEVACWASQGADTAWSV